MNHPYMPNSAPATRQAMLDAVGVGDVDELFEQIPADHLARTPVALPPAMRSEVQLDRTLRTVLARNEPAEPGRCFLGAGAWQHHVPAVCDEIAGRSEFLTSVWGTPSSDYGRNQAWFEFASQIGELVDLDFVGLPVYSWGAASGYALRMAARMTGRRRVLVPETTDPERLAVIRTLCGPSGAERSLVVDLVRAERDTGRLDLGALAQLLDTDVAAVYVENPGYLGVVETEMVRIGELAAAHGAELVVGVDPLSLGLLAAPGTYGATIVTGPTQPLGVHLHAGGGVGGFIATPDVERYAREYPTLQVSVAPTRTEGERAFGMTLFGQSSYGSREEGNDWTGNSVYLWTVVNAVYLALLGPAGIAELGHTIAGNAAYAARRLGEIDGVSVRWGGFFKEFVVDLTATGRTVAQVNAALRDRGIVGGKDLSTDFPWLGQSALLCVTEVHDADDVALLVDALKEALA